MTLWEVFFPDSGVVMVEWLTPKEIERIESWERHGSPESKSEQDRFFWRMYDLAFYRKHSFFCRLEKWWEQRNVKK